MYKLSVVIPCYKATQTIAKTLHSIAMQSIANDIEVLVVNDADGLDYSCILCKFDMHIRFIKREKNGGCGAARNTGIREAVAPYIVFVDADDQLSNSLSLEILHNRIVAEKADVVVGAFESEMRFKDGLGIRKIENSPTWCHGKIYSRQYLIDNGLFFNESLRLNEDMEFHQILFDGGAKVVNIPLVGYMWRDNPKSVTHESLYRNKKYFVLASMEYLRDCEKHNIAVVTKTHRVMQNLCVIYDYFNIVADDMPENIDDYIKTCREYWKLCKDIVADVSDEEITKVFLAVMKQQCSLIPSVTFTEFLDEIRAD